MGSGIWALVMAWKYEIALRLLSNQPRMKRAAAHAAGTDVRGPVLSPPCSRQRRRAGSFCYIVELPGPLVDRLVQLGWLAGVARNDKAAGLADWFPISRRNGIS